MTSFWDKWIEKIKKNDVSKDELVNLVNNLHSFDHENNEIIARHLNKI